MAVENRYTNADVIAGKKAIPANFNSDEERGTVITFEVAVADDDGSIFRVMRISADMIPVSITATNDAITAGTVYDFGIYDTLTGPNGGTVKDADALASNVDMSSARAEGSGVTLLSAPNIANAEQRLYELAGDTTEDHPGEYDLAFTADTVGSAAGTITVKATFVQG